MGDWPAIDSRQYIVAFELHSLGDCPPDFELPASLSGFDAGLFLPRDDPDWFGRSSYPPRILLLKGSALHVISHPSRGVPPCQYPLAQISSVESGHMLLKGWLRFTGTGLDSTVRYNTRGFPAVFPFMRRFRDRLLKCASCGTPEVDLEAGLDIKFANALKAELDRGETVLMQLFQPPRQIRSRNWLLPHRHWGAGDLVVLTGSRLLWITDRERGYRSSYGSIASYAPLDAVLHIGLISGRAGHTLQVELTSGSGWQVPIAFGSHRECQQVGDDFAAVLEIQKRRNEANRTEVRR
jgi:hypothetical protein